MLYPFKRIMIQSKNRYCYLALLIQYIQCTCILVNHVLNFYRYIESAAVGNSRFTLPCSKSIRGTTRVSPYSPVIFQNVRSKGCILLIFKNSYQFLSGKISHAYSIFSFRQYNCNLTCNDKFTTKWHHNVDRNIKY